MGIAFSLPITYLVTSLLEYLALTNVYIVSIYSQIVCVRLVDKQPGLTATDFLRTPRM